jgi:hypothetical protein
MGYKLTGFGPIVRVLALERKEFKERNMYVL